MVTTKSEHLLAIDTSGPRLQLALLGAGSVDALVDEIAKGHAEILFDRIATLLGRNAKTYADLTRLAVTTGPGSFTGLRIGISAARGLGLALKLPTIGVPNLLALSLNATNGPVDVKLDARRDEFYTQRFSTPGLPATPPSMVSAAAAVDFPTGDATLITDPRVNIETLARFALTADPQDFPPDPTYVRAADAKPQTTKLISRVEKVR